jgi:hypothetical protein
VTRDELRNALLDPRAIGVGMLAMLGTAVLLGVPSDVIPNPWFTREIAVDAFDVVTLVCLSMLAGALAATYAIAVGPTAAAGRTGVGSGLLGFVAVSCPVCNKAVVALIGTAGASGWFASLQPVLGALAIALAAAALLVRLRDIRRGACPLRAPAVARQRASA